MKNNLLLYIILLGIGYVMGFFVFSEETKTEESYEFLQEANSFKGELLDYSLSALEQAEIIMSNHEIFDKDGSDLMADYLDNCSKIDSLLQTQE